MCKRGPERACRCVVADDLICLDRSNVGAKWGEDWQCKGKEGEACFASGWYDKLSYLVHNFINTTGLSSECKQRPAWAVTVAAALTADRCSEQCSRRTDRVRIVTLSCFGSRCRAVCLA